MNYYVKALVSNTITTKSGKKIPFVDAGGGYGLLETEDLEIIKSLDERIVAHKGGVSVVTKEKFEELKKKFGTSPTLKRKPEPQLRQIGVLQPPPETQRPPAPAVVASVDVVKQAPPAPAAPESQPKQTAEAPAKPDRGPTLRAPKA